MGTLRIICLCCVIITPMIGCAGGQLTNLETKIDHTQDMIRTDRSETHAESESVKSEVANLRLRVDHLAKVQTDLLVSLDEYKMLIRSLSQSLNELNTLIDSIKTTKSPGAANTQSTPPKTDTDIDQRPEHIYQTAYNDYINRKFDLAIVEFQGFLTSFPDSDLADNSQYWIGECLYAQGKYDEARVEFEKVVTNFPNGDKEVPAFLKKGLCYLELGDTQNATSVLEDLMNRFPFSEEARIAEDRLKSITAQ